MRNEAGGPSQGSSEVLDLDITGLLRKPALVGSAGAILGLIVGILIGRATVDRTPEDAPAIAEEPAADEGAPVAEKAAPAPPGPAYRTYFGRPVPKSVRGFERLRDAPRRAARLKADQASLQFTLAPQPGEYAVTSIVGLEGSKAGTIELQIDGKALPPITLEQGWHQYSSAVPSGILTPGEHDLTVQVAGADKSAVHFDSIAVAPVGGEVHLQMGMQAAGTLVEGFGRPAAAYVWNHGPNSTVGVALTPAGSEYRLAVKASTLPHLDPLVVSAKVNGSSVGEASFAKRASVGTWTVPAGALRPGLNQIEFAYAKTLKPSDLKPNSKDDRPLALRFVNLDLEPAQ